MDLVAFAMYDPDPDVNGTWMSQLKKELELVSRFAEDHGKLVAVAETGAANATVPGDSETALLRSGNKDLDWYRRVLEVVSASPASYFLLGPNLGKADGFRVPYVMLTEGRKLYGHEMVSNFIDFYNDARSVFAGDQKTVLGSLPKVTAKAAGTAVEGYITAPVSGRQIQTGTVFTARVSRADGAKLRFVLQGKGGSASLDAVSAGGVNYRAQVTREVMEALGDCTNGTASLMAGDTVLQTIRLNSSSPFLDVPAGAYYAPAVQWALAQGITGGTTATTFSPNRTCTRAQVVTFLWRAAGSPEPIRSENPFQDLSEDAYYYKAVLWAVEQGITAGVTNTTFQPNATVTRGQTAMFLYRYAGTPEAAGETVFQDVPASAYYAPAVCWAVEQGITAGVSSTAFAPDSACTRGQIVTFLYRSSR